MTKFRLDLRLVLILWPLLSVICFVSQTTFAYGGQNSITVAYDITGEPAFNYQAA